MDFSSGKERRSLAQERNLLGSGKIALSSKKRPVLKIFRGTKRGVLLDEKRKGRETLEKENFLNRGRILREQHPWI